MSGIIEIPKTYISPEEWEYFAGAFDHILNPYAWLRENPFKVVARAEVNNTSGLLINHLVDKIGGLASVRPANSTRHQIEHQWRTTRESGLLPFLEEVEPRLHFRRPLVEAFKNLIASLEEENENDERIELFRQFQQQKQTPLPSDKYLPSPCRLAGHFDANGFIDISPDTRHPTLRQVLLVRLGACHHPGLIAALIDEYGGCDDHGDWSIFGKEAEEFLRFEIDYLQVFQERAKLAIEFQNISARFDRRRGPGSKRDDDLNEVLKHNSRGKYDLRRVLQRGFRGLMKDLNQHPI